MSKLPPIDPKNISKKSTLRKGRVWKLDMGELPVFDLNNKDTVISTTNGVSVVSKKKSRCIVETFPVVIKRSIPYNQLKSRPFDTLVKQFIEQEEKEVLKRIYGSDEVVTAEPEEVSRLRKFFRGIGKNVAVLPNGEVFDFDRDDFTLVVRKDVELMWSNNPSKMSMDLIIWEEIGFMYEAMDI